MTQLRSARPEDAASIAEVNVSQQTALRSEPDPEYDVFISRVTEDKDDVVRPLAEVLRDEGLRVWYDEYELRVGDSLRRKIDQGLASSRFGVVLLSRPPDRPTPGVSPG